MRSIPSLLLIAYFSIKLTLTCCFVGIVPATSSHRKFSTQCHENKDIYIIKNITDRDDNSTFTLPSFKLPPRPLTPDMIALLFV